MRSSAAASALCSISMLGAQLGCSTEPVDDGVSIGLLLSYSGELAANSTNSERALQMAIEVANANGGVAGRPVRIVARDTRSDVTKVVRPASELDAAGVAMFIGPDTPELAVPLVSPLGDRTIILPSFATSHSPFRRPPGWFVMGAGTARVACELAAQVRAHGRSKPLVLVDTNGYNSLLAWELTRTYGMPQVVLPSHQASNTSTVRPIAAVAADSYVLAALPASASSLVFALAAIGALGDPGAWYLSPTLHSPALLENIPKGALVGAHGVAPGTIAGAKEFGERFAARWQDQPLDDAYPFFDAGAVAVLALQRAMSRDGAIPTGSGLSQHVAAVTHPAGRPVQWNQIDLGLMLLRNGQEIEYVGLSGPLEFDISGQTPTANTNWWTIADEGFLDIPGKSDCR